MFESRIYFSLEFYKSSSGSYEMFDYYDLYDNDQVFDMLNNVANKGIEAAKLYFFCSDIKTLVATFKKKITNKDGRKIINWVVSKDI
jgi:hypothetical protein